MRTARIPAPRIGIALRALDRRRVATDPATRRRPWRGDAGWLLLLVAASLAIRLAVIGAPAKDMLVHGYEQRRMDFNDEEVHRANVAGELLDGPVLSGWLDYQYVDFFGGSTVVSMVAAPFMAVLGRNFFALKLAPILFHLITTAFLFAVLRRAFGRGAAIRGTLLLVITPPAFTALTTVAFGSHVESIGIAAMATWVFARLHSSPQASERGGSEAGRFLLGLLAGFALFFGYQTLLWTAAFAAADLCALRRRALLRAWIPQLGGAALGLWPWLIYNARIDWSGYRIYNQEPGGLIGTLPLQKSADLVTSALPRALDPGRRLGLDEPWIGAAVLIIGAAVAAIGVGAAFTASRRARRALPAAPRVQVSSVLVIASLLHVAAFLVMHAVTRFHVGRSAGNVCSYRYAFVMAPSVVILIAAGWRAVRDHHAARRILDGVLCTVLALQLAGNAGLMDLGRVGALNQLTATHDQGLGRWMGYRLLAHPERFAASVERVPEHFEPERARDVVIGMADLLAFLSRHADLASPDLNLTPEQVESARRRAASALPEPYADLIWSR